jgi:hypothetical protein
MINKGAGIGEGIRANPPKGLEKGTSVQLGLEKDKDNDLVSYRAGALLLERLAERKEERDRERLVSRIPF